MTSVVFDANSLLQAAGRRNGPAGRCLEYVHEGRVTILFSDATIAEIRDVLARPKIRKSFRNLTDDSVQEYLDKLLDKALVLPTVPNAFRMPRDPDDEPYLDLAIAADASYIVSRDKDLLDLTADESFRLAYPNLLIVDPVEFLNNMRAEGKSPADPLD